ncbi:hypothetical protein O1611_g2540 [Lasiodiplodia mahajangana]|uniref:Uncharacterized protein n=1 Tax=Lasiodiplodia mahajangana TaxID=1108764 RepID=A0ACC2JUS4_9PEZI|nr:hypothetical protein O1611_g2540 [Lasiodiplodia mahajangana]
MATTHQASNSAFPTGMAHAPRVTAPPSHPLPPTSSPRIGYTSPAKSQAGGTPPFLPVVTHGALVYGDATAGDGSPIEVNIQAVIDKGFFLSDGDWTCYRRNYLSCICSYSLAPYYPNANMQYIANGSTTSYPVFGFAMSISAVVAESNSQNIDLVQHTPQRNKSPTATPGKVRMLPKPHQRASNPLKIYSDHSIASGSKAIYESGHDQAGQGPFATEHTFERVQFKQATANNGKRRAAQQYFHLMIVRGRSPGHYQTERRGATSSGPGGLSGMGSYSGSQVLGGDYWTSASSLLPSSMYSNYNNIGMRPMIPTDNSKSINTTEKYQYYPSTIYEGIEMFDHGHEPDTMPTRATTGINSAMSKVKHGYDNTLPSTLYSAGSTNVGIPGADAISAYVSNWLSPLDPSSNYNVALSSRHPGSGKWFLAHTAPEQDIEASIRWARDRDIFPIRNDLVQEDMKAYIRARVRGPGELNKKWHTRPDIQAEIEVSLIEKAAGMFRWVSCQLDELEKRSKPRGVRRALTNLPESLDETYARIIASIPHKHKQVAIRILQFLTFSERPLSLEEVVDSIAVDTETRTFDPAYRTPVPREILKCCSNLIVIAERQNNYNKAHKVNEIQFAHFSVKEYLVSDRLNQSITPDFEITAAKASLACVCLIYLLALPDNCSLEQIREDYPMAVYAAQYWTSHAVAANTTNSLVENMIAEFFACQSTFQTCYRLHQLDAPWDRDEKSEIPSTLYYASYAGIRSSVQLLLDKGADVNTQGGHYGNALQAASFRGHETIVRILLDKGADVNAQGGRYGNALQAASSGGHETIIQILLDKGANVNSQDGYCGKYVSDDDSVSESISAPSIPSDLGDRSTRATPHSPRREILEAIADFLAEMLLQDVELRKLFKLALENPKIGGDRFQRNFRRTLVAYSKDLRAIADGPQEYGTHGNCGENLHKLPSRNFRTSTPGSGTTLANVEAEEGVNPPEIMEEPRNIRESTLHTPLEGNSESASELEGNLNDENKLPTLQLMKAFLTRNSPLATLREKLQILVNPASRSRQFSGTTEMTDRHPPDVESEKEYDQCDQPETQQTALEQGIPVQIFSAKPLESFPDFVDYIMRLLHFPVWSPPIPSGMRRVKWRCKCGTNLYDDYIERKPGALKDLEAKLRAVNGGSSQSSNRITPTLRTYFPALFNLINQMIPPPRWGRNDNEIPLAIVNGLHRANNPRLSEAGIFHLLCCIHTDMTGITLHQERIENMNTDKQVMNMLGEVYRTRRRIKSWFTMRDVSHLRLVKFSLDFSCFVQVYAHATSCQHPDCFCLPELDRVRQREYHCQPAPEDTSNLDPILGDNYLLHYLKNPQCIDDKQTSIFNQLPKRAAGRLAASHSKRELGWGVYFEEGWHMPSVYSVFFGFFGIASLAFGVAWSVWKADIQSAFTIASFLTADETPDQEDDELTLLARAFPFAYGRGGHGRGPHSTHTEPPRPSNPPKSWSFLHPTFDTPTPWQVEHKRVFESPDPTSAGDAVYQPPFPQFGYTNMDSFPRAAYQVSHEPPAALLENCRVGFGEY